MNVWIWGPPLWETLHAGAILYDSNKRSAIKLFRPLRRLLPCRYCRDSYNGFYEALQDPPLSAAAPWIFTVHGLVNAKLQRQRAEAYATKYGLPEELAEQLFATCGELAAEPTLEVILKRFIVNREEPFVWRSMSAALLAIVMGLEISTDDLYNDMHEFLEGLIEVLELSKQENASELIGCLKSFKALVGAKKPASELRSFIETEKYESILGSIFKSATEASRLVKAGACVAGTCA